MTPIERRNLLIAIIVLGTYSYRTLVDTRTDIAEPKNFLESVLPEDRELEVVRPEASVSLSQLKNNILNGTVLKGYVKVF